MVNTKIEVNFQIDNEFIPYGENKPIKTLKDYEEDIGREINVILRGLYPEYKNLEINVITNSLS